MMTDPEEFNCGICRKTIAVEEIPALRFQGFEKHALCRECQTKREKKDQEKRDLEDLKQRVVATGIPKIEITDDCEIHPLDANKQRLLEQILSLNVGVYIVGDTGRGKSRLMAHLIYEFAIHRHIDARMFPAAEFLNQIKARYGGGDSYSFFMSTARVPVLGINDLMKHPFTEDNRSKLIDLIDYRWENRLLTFFTSQSDINKVSEFLDVSTGSRLRHMCKPVVINGPDYRQNFPWTPKN